MKDEEDETIAAPLEQETTDRLYTETREEWAKHGLVRAACAQRARIAHNVGDAPETSLVKVRGWQPKGFFLSAERLVYGGVRTAQELTQALEYELTASE